MTDGEAKEPVVGRVVVVGPSNPVADADDEVNLAFPGPGVGGSPEEVAVGVVEIEDFCK
jgi:hypothetical protein